MSVSVASGERLVVVGGAGLGAASFVPWYKPDEWAYETARTNGWEAPDALLSQVATLVGVGLAVAVVVAARGSVRPGAGGVSWGTLLTGASGLVLALLALKLSMNSDGTMVGLYLAMVAAATQLYGAYVTRLDEGSTAAPPGGWPPPPDEPAPPPPVAGRPPAPTPTPAPASPGTASPGTAASGTAPPGTAPPGTASPGTAPSGRASPGTAPSGPAPSGTVAPGAAPSGTAPPAVPVEPPVAAPDPVQVWPETAWFLAAYLQPGTDVEPAAWAYRAQFAADPARLARLAAELGDLVAAPVPGPAGELVARQAPRWADHDVRHVLARVRHALDPGQQP